MSSLHPAPSPTLAFVARPGDVEVQVEASRDGGRDGCPSRRRAGPYRSCPGLEHALEGADLADHVVVDLSGCTFIDSSALRGAPPAGASGGEPPAEASRSSPLTRESCACSRSPRPTRCSRCTTRSNRHLGHRPAPTPGTTVWSRQSLLAARVQVEDVVEERELEYPSNLSVGDDDSQLPSRRSRAPQPVEQDAEHRGSREAPRRRGPR